MTELRTRTEYRALVLRPASIYATPAERRRGYTERWTASGSSREAVLREDYDLCHSEETGAYVVAWEERKITLDPWKCTYE